VALPAYSDRKVEHGKTYRYEISSVDKKSNESDKSASAEVVF
jgi:fibronectin type 3 domain-containing protein